MTSCVDPAVLAVDEFMKALAEVYDPKGVCPPPGGGSNVVRFFAGGTEVLPAWAPLLGCEDPLLWVRVANRFRSRASDFPAAFVADQNCARADVFSVLAVEVGVSRCTSMEADIDFDVLHDEALIALDDSWRIERALRLAAKRIRDDNRRCVATDTVLPVGPAGGVTAWTGMAHVQLC